MRIVALTTCFCLVLCSSGVAQDDFLFRGAFLITSKSAECGAFDPVGNDGAIRFRVSSDGQGSGFAFYEDGLAQAFRLPAGLFDSTYKAVQTMTIRSRFAAVPNPV